MKIEKFGIYLADLAPAFGTEPGKLRPVVVVQTDLLNNTHPSTIVCPVTSNVIKELDSLRVHLSDRETGLRKDSDILVDQIRAIDNRRFQKKLGKLSLNNRNKLLENLELLILN